MNQSLLDHIKNLKSALLSLSATGESGFEGLIGVALREISGVPFRLAASGLQFGIDGKSAYEEDAICFEGKRYDNKVPRAEVLSKISDLSIHDNFTDIWILGASCIVSTQVADSVRALGAKDGIFILILDWSDTDLPPLSVALAMGGDRVIDFLESNIVDDKMFREALVALEEIKCSKDFSAHADRIRRLCNEPSVGISLALRANNEWLNDVFSNRLRAKIKLGQPLSPGDTNTASIRQRKTLNDELNVSLTASSENEKIVCILGGEGCGKSWIVAQNWLTSTHKSLMVFMIPEDFSEASGQNDVVDLLITKLIIQTGNRVTEITRERWRRKIERWRSIPATDSPRLIVVIDGINQRPQHDWARIIDSIGDELNQLGGRLIVTARTQHFRNNVKNRLSVPYAEINIPEWTDIERDEILAGHDIKASDLHHAVATSLRNPRLLGIALELFGKADVISFEELSTSRLLFEHIRISERDSSSPQPAFEFVQELQRHAQIILSRVEMKQQDDLKVFETDMGAVADGRFFKVVDGDPTRYSLIDDGLILALGFSVVDRLRTALRNNRNLDAVLDAILEPIAALDNTADVVIAALTVAVIDDNHEQDVIVSLVKGFTALQNPDEAKFPAFTGLVKSCPQGFMDAAGVLSLAGGHQLNFDWIRGALIIAGRNSSVWQHMISHVHSWLSVYSLSPKRGTFSHPTHDPQVKVQEEREKNRKKIELKLKSLSGSEQAIYESLLEEKGDLSRLTGLALVLLAGKPLEPFAKSLLSWSFSNALNSDHVASYNDFINLVRLNRIDWAQTRVALMDACVMLREADVSTTGKWALVNILRATGLLNDAVEARALVDDLTKDQEHFEGWRLIEDYCSTDPCDPASEQPENIMQTSEQYAAIDVSKLNLTMGQSLEDMFFRDARLGIARFKPEIAVTKHKKLITDALSRTGVPLRQGLLELRKHNALLTIQMAHEFIEKWNKEKIGSVANSQSENEDRFVSQYHLLLAFPFLSAKEQFDCLLLNTESILFDLINITKPLDEAEFESLLVEACNEDDENKQYLLLVLANELSVQLSANVCDRVVQLLQSKSERVRIQALGVVSKNDNIKMLESVAESDWRAVGTEAEDRFEAWYGSIAILKAATHGLITHDEALDRISVRLYEQAALMLDDNAVSSIARYIDASINQVIGMSNDLIAPDIDIQVDQSAPYGPNRVNVSDPEIPNNIEKMMRLSESNDAFMQRQKRNHDTYFKYEANLTKAKARIIIDNMSLNAFSAIVEKNDLYADRWYELFMNIDDAKLPAVHNLILLLAHALGEKVPEKTKELFNRVKGSKPFVWFRYGKSGVLLDSVSIWSGGLNPVMDEIRFKRLDRMRTDHDLFIEVLSALLNDRQELLAEYVAIKLGREEPAENARGIMVAGFSDQSEFNDGVINRYENSVGLIGSAHQAAKYAYERNVWARHWFEKMSQAENKNDFWRLSLLFSKIVDGRLSVWQPQFTQKEEPFMLFWPAVRSGLKNRFDRCENDRKKNLFGSKAPALIFLEDAEADD